ncbi:hypothetical protein C478_02835, partial [Natrinema thermotolerans DSM 11552]
APFDSVCVLSDDAFEETSIVFVATEARWFRVFRDRRVRLVMIRLLAPEETAPRFGVCPSYSLGGGRTENGFVF